MPLGVFVAESNVLIAKRIDELTTPVKEQEEGKAFSRVLSWLQEHGFRLLCDSVLTTESWDDGKNIPKELPVMQGVFDAPMNMEKVYQEYQVCAVSMTFAPDPIRLTSEAYVFDKDGDVKLCYLNLVLTENYVYAYADDHVFSWDGLERYDRDARNIPISFPIREDGEKPIEIKDVSPISMTIPAFYSVLRKQNLLFDNMVSFKWRNANGCSLRVLSSKKQYQELCRDLEEEGYGIVKTTTGQSPDGAADEAGDHFEYEEKGTVYVSRSGIFRVCIYRKKGVGRIVSFRDLYTTCSERIMV